MDIVFSHRAPSPPQQPRIFISASDSALPGPSQILKVRLTHCRCCLSRSYTYPSQPSGKKSFAFPQPQSTYQVNLIPILLQTPPPTISMPVHQSTSTNPRQRLSILTNSTLGHDVSAAFKASSASRASQEVGETPAPPPSPVDFSFPSTPAEHRSPGGSESN